MRRAKVLLVAVVALGVLLFGAAVAHAGWEWNAKVNVENTKLGLGWGVTDDVNGAADYSALITVTLPEGANASVQKVAPNETVVLNSSDGLACGPDGIEANVAYRVSPLNGANGSQVSVTIATVAGQKPAATGDVLGAGTGQVGEDISVHVLVPGSCG
jgi:hypothetical protein